MMARAVGACLVLLALSACGGGSSSAGGVPDLVSVAELRSYPVDARISIFRLVNRGGAPETCALGQGQTLPAGLTLAVSADRASCSVSGTPTAQQSAQTYTITATNSAGSSSATVRIRVTAANSAVGACASGSPASGRTSRYRVDFISQWSVANNGGVLPAGAGFSPLTGATHGADYELWAPGGVVSGGLQTLAGTGSNGALRSEINRQIRSNRAGRLLSGGGLNSATGSISISFEASCAYPLVSLVSKLRPSPDWFVGVYDVALVDEDMGWVEASDHRLFVYDAGVRSGNRFTVAGADIIPPRPVALLMGNQAIGFTGGREQIGRIVFDRLQ